MRFVILPLIALSVGFAPAPVPKENPKRVESTDVGGIWEFVSCAHDGKPNPGLDKLYRIEMTRERFDYAVLNGKGRIEYDMRLDPAASPPSFTLSMGKNMLWVGSYRLNKDEITMIFQSGTNVNQRPTDFTGKPATHYVLRRIRR